MKYKLIILIIVFMSCKEKHENYSNRWVLVSGNDTIVYYSSDTLTFSDGRKLHGHFHGHGGKDTVNKIYFDTTWLEPTHDTIYVYNYRIKYKNGDIQVISNNQSGGITAKEIINNH